MARGHSPTDGGESPVAEIAVVLAGPIGTGKTCFCVRVHEGEFHSKYAPTISPDYSKVYRSVPGRDGSALIQLWDTSGEERFRALAKHYYRAKHCVILMYDASDPVTAEDLLKFVTGESGVADGARLGIGAVVVANKADLLSGDSERSSAERLLDRTRIAVGEALAGSEVAAFLVSVKTEENVEAALEAAVRVGMATKAAWDDQDGVSATGSRGADSRQREARGVRIGGGGDPAGGSCPGNCPIG